MVESSQHWSNLQAVFDQPASEHPAKACSSSGIASHGKPNLPKYSIHLGLLHLLPMLFFKLLLFQFASKKQLHTNKKKHEKTFPKTAPGPVTGGTGWKPQCPPRVRWNWPPTHPGDPQWSDTPPLAGCLGVKTTPFQLIQMDSDDPTVFLIPKKTNQDLSISTGLP